MKRSLLFSIAAFLSPIATAQGVTVSPAQSAGAEGSSSSSHPFNKSTPRRYQQIHSDIGTGVKVIKQLSFRLNEVRGTFPGTRVLDLELQMGAAPDYASISTTYSANYVGAPTTVIRRTKVNFGAQGPGYYPGPSPFRGMDLTFATQFLHTGQASLIWDAKIFQNISHGARGSADADQSSFSFGTMSTRGIGCVATGRNNPMTVAVSVADTGGTLGIGLGVNDGPSSVPYWISLGTSDPQVSAPGWCTKLHTNNLAMFVAGVTDAHGFGDMTEGFSRHVPNTLGGQIFTCQILALDPWQASPVKVALSHGRTLVLPRPNTLKVVRVSRMFDDTGTATATRGVRYSLATVGLGLVTRFSH